MARGSARWNRKLRQLRRYGNACNAIGGVPGYRFPRRFIAALWHRDQGRCRRFATKRTADGDLVMIRRDLARGTS